VVSESRVTWATSVSILVFLGISVLELGPMYATDVRRASSLNAGDENNLLGEDNKEEQMLFKRNYGCKVSFMFY